MFEFTRQQGYIAIFFFISLIIIGVMIFLNLFLAILLENFDDDEEEEEESGFQSIYQKANEFKVKFMELSIRFKNWASVKFTKSKSSEKRKNLTITEGPLD